MYLVPLAGLALYFSMRTPAGVPTSVSKIMSKDAARGVTMKCQEKYCPPNYQIHVDKPMNTLQRDDSLNIAMTDSVKFPDPSKQVLGHGLYSTLEQVYDKTKSQYFKEAHEHPGVRLVAHTVS